MIKSIVSFLKKPSVKGGIIAAAAGAALYYGGPQAADMAVKVLGWILGG